MPKEFITPRFGIPIMIELSTTTAETHMTTEYKICLILPISCEAKAIPISLFIPIDIFITSIVTRIITNDAILDASPIVPALVNLAVISQKANVNTEEITMPIDEYQIFLPASVPNYIITV
ncbi:MAG: hypothetical protein ACREBU_17680, partial [Nitrososphaera sp.]